jgi:hypothetical protein
LMTAVISFIWCIPSESCTDHPLLTFHRVCRHVSAK